MDTFQRLTKLLTKEVTSGFKAEDILPGRSLENIGGDSLDAVDLRFSIEDEFGIEVGDDDIDETTSFSDMVALIDARCAA